MKTIAFILATLGIAAGLQGCNEPDHQDYRAEILSAEPNDAFIEYTVEDPRGDPRTALAFNLGRPSVTVLGEDSEDTLHATIVEGALVLRLQSGTTSNVVEPEDCDPDGLAVARAVLEWQADAPVFRLSPTEGGLVLGCIGKCYGRYPNGGDAANGCSSGCYNGAAYN